MMGTGAKDATPIRGRWVTSPGTLGAVVAVWTVLAFLPTVRNGFVGWDDVHMFLENPHHRGSWAMRMRGAWTAHLLGEYMPVTWTSYALDRALWDLDAAGYHLTSLGLHVATTLAVYALAWRLLGLARGQRLDRRARALSAAVAALAFGVHPLRAEPVAWLSARGTVLGGLLLVLAVLAYLAGWERGRAEGRVPRPWLAAVAGLFVASVLARATGLVLPALLLLLDVYPLRRVPDPPAGGWVGPGTRRALAEKLGLVALGALAIPMGFLARSARPGEFWRVEYDPLVAGAWSVYSGAFYVWKTLCPWNLGPIYAMPSRGDFGGAGVALAASTVAGITLAAIAARRRWPAALAAWIAYAVILAPVSGVVPFGRLLGVVDRYSYTACIGWAIAAGGAVAVAWEAWDVGRLPRWRATLTAAVIAGVLLGWSVLTWRQVQVWRDSGRLWMHAVTVSPTCVRCHVNLANWLAEEGRGEQALAHYGRALALDPEQIALHTNIGLVLVRFGRPAEAVPHYERVLARYPERLPVRVSLAVALVAAGRLPEAVARLEEAAPFSSPDRLVDHFRQLTTAQPAAPVPRLGLLQAYARAGDRVGAHEAYEALARLHPALALASQVHAAGSGASLRP